MNACLGMSGTNSKSSVMDRGRRTALPRGGRRGSRRKKNKKFYAFVEEGQGNDFDSTQATYYYEETENTLTFLNPVEHLDYESSDSDEELDDGGSVINAEDGADTTEEILAASRVNVPPVETPWELTLDDESGAYYYYNHHTYETSWEKPADLCEAETRALNKARFKVIRERRKRQRNVDLRYNERIAKKQQLIDTRRKSLSNAIHEGFYATSEIRHAAEVLLIENQNRRRTQLDIAARYYAKDMIDKASSSLLLARKSGARSLNVLLTLAHSHQVVWNQSFDFHTAFRCDPKEALSNPPPTSRQFRKRKKLLLTALEAYSASVPMSLRDSEEYASSSQSVTSQNSGTIVLGPNTDVTASILLQSAKVLSNLGDYNRASKLIQKLFSQHYLQNASAGTALVAGILGWGLLKNIGGYNNVLMSAKMIQWVANNVDSVLTHEIRLQREKASLFEKYKSNSSDKEMLTHESVFISTFPPPFFGIHECNDDAARALRVTCLLVYAQLMVNLNMRSKAIVAILDCFSYAYRGDGWTDEVHETPVSWFNSPATFVAAGSAASEILTEDGIMIAEFCYMQAIMRGDGSLKTLLTYAVIQFKLGRIDDAVFTLCNALNSHSYYDYTTRALLSAWSTPWRKKFGAEVDVADVLIRFFRISLAKKRMARMKQSAIEQLKKDEENLKKIAEFWRHKGEGWVKRTFLKWIEYWVAEMADKNAAARVLQNRCKGVNAKKELWRRRERKRHIEGVVVMNIAKVRSEAQTQ